MLVSSCSTTRKWHVWLVLGLPLGALWLLYGQTLFKFVPADTDDLVYLTLARQHSALYFWFHDQGREYVLWRPVTTTAFWLEMQIFGFHVWGYYFAGLLYASATVLLFFALAKRLSGSVLAAGVAALFLVLNRQNQNVFGWLIESHEAVLAGFFFTLSIYLFIIYQDSRSRLTLVAAGVAALLAALSKEPGFGCVAFIAVLAWARRRTISCWPALFMVTLTAVFYFLGRYLVLGTIFGVYTPHPHRAFLTLDLGDTALQEFPPGVQAMLMGYNVVSNFVGMFVPSLFTTFGQLRPIVDLHASPGYWLSVTLGVLLLCVIFGCALWQSWRRDRGMTLALLAGSLGVSLTLIATYYRERSHFPGFIAVCLLLAMGLGRLPAMKPAWIRPMLFTCLGAICLIFTRLNLQYLDGESTLLRQTDVLKQRDAANIISDEVRAEISRRYPPSPAPPQNSSNPDSSQPFDSK